MPEETPIFDEVESLWNRCGEYLLLAANHLLPGANVKPLENKPSPKIFDPDSEARRVRYLFPERPEHFVKLLVALRECQWIANALKNNPGDSEIRAQHSIEQIEADHRARTEEVQKALADFTRVQKKILNEFYFWKPPEA